MAANPSEDGFPPSRVQLGLLIFCGAAFVAHAIWLACVAEDSYITYRFARNVVEGHGFVWNVGAGPVEGFSNFLWLQLCVVALKLRLDPGLVTQVVGVVAGVATLLVTWHFARRVLRVSHAGALFSVATLAAAGPLAAWASSGMETVFFTLCVTSAVYYASFFTSSADPRLGFLTACALFAATLTRPEGFGIACIVLGTVVCFSSSRSQRRQAFVVAAAYSVAFAVYFMWRYVTFGYPLPNTFYAKTGGGWSQYWRGFVYLAYFSLHYLAPWIPWVVLFAWHASDRFRFPGVSEAAARVGKNQRLAGLVIAGAVITGYLGYVMLVGGDYMAMYRFIVPVLPLMFAVLGLSADHAMNAVAMNAARRTVIAALMLATLGGMLLQSTPYEQSVFSLTPHMHGTYRGIATERWHVNRFHVIARFFSHHAPDRSSILTWDIGVVGYATRFTIHDALGIVDPVIAHERPDGAMGQGLAGHEKQDLSYSYSLRPTFVMYTVQLRPAPADWPRYPPALDARVRAEYEKKSVWLTDCLNDEAGYFTYLERKRR
jgi:arabinofuranosyltransferase